MKKVIGQDPALRMLRGIIISQRFPKALLFHGPAGVGKFLAAIEYAKLINETKDFASDNRMRSLIDLGEHPDVKVFSKGDDKTFKIDVIRQALKEVMEPRVEATRRVMIFKDIQYFPSYQQGDALLKVIEDGLDDTLFIFTTTEIDKVFPTLKSRMTTVQFNPLDEFDMRVMLDAYKDSEGFDTALKMSRGSLDHAIRLMTKTETRKTGLETREMAFRILKYLNRITKAQIITFLSKVLKEDYELFMETVMTVLKDVMLVSSGMVSEVSNTDRMEDLEQLAAMYNEKKLEALYFAYRTYYDRRHVNGILNQHQIKCAFLTMSEVS